MKNRLILSALCLGALVSGCREEGGSSAALSESALFKPSLAVVPLIDNSDRNLDWDVSEEITYTLCRKLDQKNLFNLALPSKIRSQTRRMKGKNNPFGDDIAWVKTVFAEEDFVLFLELIEHNEVPAGHDPLASPAKSPAELKIALRIRLIDNRGDTPKIRLQEILQDSHFIPKQFNRYNFHQCSWDNEDFALSPTGMAHMQLIKEIKERIEAYVFFDKGKKS